MTALMTMIHSTQTADGHGDMHEGERELGHGHEDTRMGDEDMRMGDEDFDELRLCDELARENRQLVAEALGEGDAAAPAAAGRAKVAAQVKPGRPRKKKVPVVVPVAGQARLRVFFCMLNTHASCWGASRTGEPHCGSHCHDRTAAPPLPVALPMLS